MSILIGGIKMKRFIEGESRTQSTLLPETLDDYIADTNPVRVVDVFVDELDLGALGFEGITPAATGRPAYHPADLLKIYIYGYLNRIQSSRRLEREAQRNVELMWLKFPPDAGLQDDCQLAAKTTARRFAASAASSWCCAAIEHGMKLHRYWSSNCQQCALKDKCTPSTERRVTRWEHETVLDEMQARLDQAPDSMRIRRQTVEHPFGTISLCAVSTFPIRNYNVLSATTSRHIHFITMF